LCFGGGGEVLVVTSEGGTPQGEKTVARVTVTTDTGLLPVVVDFVRRVAHRAGLRERAAERLDVAVDTVCRNVIEYAFEGGE
jgi:anti-sigma regulatory factor (Ser/Thr protein kinase)